LRAVAIDARCEGPELLLRALGSRGHAESREIRTLEAERFEGRHVAIVARGSEDSRRGRGVRLDVEGLEGAAPRVAIRGEDRERAARAAHDLVLLEEGLVLREVQSPSLAFECGAHRFIAPPRRGLVVAVREHGVHAQVASETRDGARGFVVHHVQAAAALAQALAQRDDGPVDELDAPVAPGEAIEDRAIEHENAMQLPACARRLVQAGIVLVAQVAPEPEERRVVPVHAGTSPRQSGPKGVG
jgi:hypothetical protein